MRLTYIPARFNASGHHKTAKNRTSNLLFNILAFLLITAGLALIGVGFTEMSAPISILKSEQISLDPVNLFEYSLRTTLRMFIALVFSLIFSLLYATIAAKNSYAEEILVPLLDILQSVPILGYISFTVTGFLLLFPNSIMGAECAAIFAIFTSQAWNLTFSFYQSLKTIPKELIEASSIFKMSKWQRFWRVELPFGIPSLVGNVVVSMSGGWFFVVAAEVISVGNNKISLPGIGSYISLALEQENIPSIIYALTAMILIIIIYDQLILRTLVAWSDKFHYESTGSSNAPKSWVLTLFTRNLFINKLFLPIIYFFRFIVYFPLFNHSNQDKNLEQKQEFVSYHYNRTSKYLWYFALFVIFALASYYLFNFLQNQIKLSELLEVLQLVLITMLRVFTLVIIASIIWIPIGIYIGLHPKLAAVMQPITQFLAAFPANLLFPLAVIGISKYDLNPNIWLSPLMIVGAQWYILFNVITGSSSFPTELREASKNFNIKGLLWWRKVMLPGIVPYFITGAITASGGAWNASIVAEVVSWGDKKIVLKGIGSYITQMTIEADFHRIVLGIGVMSLCIALINHFFWQPLYNYSAKKYKF
ncbi:MAG: ABC transporter permease subunit [Rickettsiaceae bacterium]|nr:ABC transporter permease subunit [Rickettsiaceae bacterium]BBB56273.1 sulfonate ABC transporter permease [Candidatus Megaera polyxenophila]